MLPPSWAICAAVTEARMLACTEDPVPLPPRAPPLPARLAGALREAPTLGVRAEDRFDDRLDDRLLDFSDLSRPRLVPFLREDALDADADRTDSSSLALFLL
mmetsp:Transcript_2964/g.5524  ORF Transcript_2964/g.5524 Transcript_2964/m.5524 type:complete len:102 (+) Transcript_2964:808-1113(+)